MGDQREFRPRFVIALAVLSFLLPVLSTSAPSRGMVWFADRHILKAVDPETNALTQAIGLTHESNALAADPESGGVWVLLDRHVLKLSALGDTLLDIDVGRLHPDIDHPEDLIRDPYDGVIWVAGGKEIVKLSAAGQPLAYWRGHKKIEAAALDIDETLWVLTHRDLHHLSRSGTELGSVDLPTVLLGAERLAVDGLGSLLWITDHRRLLRFDLNHITEPPREFPALGLEDDKGEEVDAQTVHHTRALAVHPLLGTVWVATFRHLRMFDRAGNELKTIELPRAIGIANAMVFDPVSASLWIGGSRGIGRFSGNGELMAVIPVNKDADHLSAAGFTLRPDVSVQEPNEGALTNNPRPPIRLQLGATCSGVPCLLPDAYTQSLHLDAVLNGTAIGSEFTIDGADAYYEPAPLPEGQNILAVQSTDLFGHSSEAITRHFTVDTVPPKFVSITPADGSTVNSASVTITGSVDDPTANVILADGEGNGISLGGAAFSFSVPLAVGLNTFALTARDPAGNETTVALRITYNAVSVKIMSPAAGAALNRRGVVVSGDFTGPVNTGISVNGAIAQVFGSRFYVNLSLQVGANTLTATATTPSGANATDMVSVTVEAPAVGPAEITVEPQSGVGPLTVRFSATSDTANAITQLSVDTNGDGTSDVVASNPTDPLEYTYESPGVYQAKITTTDSSGAASEETAAIVVHDAQQMDQLFTALWDGMNDALVQGDIEAAVSYLNEGAKRKYRPVFEVLKPHLPGIIASYSPLSRVSISSDIGEYAVVRPNNGQNQLYLIYFLRGVDGIWRVDEM
jgi:PKD repeat protein